MYLMSGFEICLHLRLPACRVFAGDILRQRLEPDGRPAGDGPRAPARPDQAGHRLQAHLQGHHRGAHPTARQGEERGTSTATGTATGTAAGGVAEALFVSLVVL